MKFSSIIFIGISILRRNPEKSRDCHGHKYKTINISNTNPIMRKSAILLSLATVAMALISCQKETPEVPSLVPLKSISVTCDGETAEGVIDDAAKTIKFVFNNCEQFTSVDITADLWKGWTITYPATLEGVDLQNTPTINFKSPENKVVKYGVTFSSNAFPIVNSAKIQIEGLDEGANITVDNTTKVITVKFDRDNMDLTAITVKFNEGALQEGTTVSENLTFNFAESNEYDLVLNLGGERHYTLKLDVSDYIEKTLSDYGFQDVSADYGLSDAEKEIVQVYKATGISSIPVPVLNTSLYNPSWDWATYNLWLYGSSNPRNWECVESDYSDHIDKDHDDEIFLMPGDWPADRPGMNCWGDIHIVLIDRGAVKAEITGAADGLAVSSANGLVVTTGWSVDEAATNYRVWDEGSVVRAGHDSDVPAYRASIGVTSDGKIGFNTLTADRKIVPFQDITPAEPASVAAACTETWDVKDAAWVAGWGVRDGKALKIRDIINNDGNQWVSDYGVLGMGWASNFYNVHNVIGYTYDGKIAIMINNAGNCNWDGLADYQAVDNYWQIYNDWGFNYRGYSLRHMFYIAQKLGWIDAAVLGNSTDASAMKPVVKVKGQSLTGDNTDYTTAYTLTFNAR